MRIISHRGNVSGPNKQLENNPEHIINVLNTTPYDVEIDVWYDHFHFYLGHDGPEYLLDNAFQFLNNNRLWIHAKNIEALNVLLKFYYLLSNKPQIFSHDKDPVTLTYPKGFLWVYPGEPLVADAIAVMPEITNYSDEELHLCYAICTDYPRSYYLYPQ